MRLDEIYTTPDESHAAMEPHATIAAWEGEKLTLWTSNQMIAWGKRNVAKTLGIPEANVRLDSPDIGGGFGGKLILRADAVLAALGAQAVGRLVKLALTRPLVANNTTHRGAERFGWSRRDATPGRRREGRWLVGMGVAAGFRNNLVMKSAARVPLDSGGTVTVETDMTHIGTGSYTIISQTAGEMMGVGIDRVAVRLGDSSFPVSAGSGGQ